MRIPGFERWFLWTARGRTERRYAQIRRRSFRSRCQTNPPNTTNTPITTTTGTTGTSTTITSILVRQIRWLRRNLRLARAIRRWRQRRTLGFALCRTLAWCKPTLPRRQMSNPSIRSFSSSRRLLRLIGHRRPWSRQTRGWRARNPVNIAYLPLLEPSWRRPGGIDSQRRAQLRRIMQIHRHGPVMPPYPRGHTRSSNMAGLIGLHGALQKRRIMGSSHCRRRPGMRQVLEV